MVAGNQNWNTQLQGTDVDFPLIRSWQIDQGAFFTPIDVTTASKVVVIGSVVRDQLFGPDVDPVGQVIRVQNQPFTIIGVLASKGQSGVGQDQDDVAFTPYTTVMKKIRGITFIQHVQVSAISASEVAPVRRRDRRRSCASATRFSPATRTTSWCARSRKWPTSARKRPRP